MHVPSDVRLYQSKLPRFTGDAGPWLEHLIEDEGIPYAHAREMIAGWEMIPYKDEAHGHMATLMKKNKEVHFAIFRRYRKRSHVTTERIKQFLQPILDDEVFLVTKVGPDEGSAFIEHLGFEQLGVTIDGVRTFILNEIKYPKAKSCKS